MDRVDLKGKRCKDLWLLIAMHWITDAVELMNKDKKDFTREYEGARQLTRLSDNHSWRWNWLVRENDIHGMRKSRAQRTFYINP